MVWEIFICTEIIEIRGLKYWGQFEIWLPNDVIFVRSSGFLTRFIQIKIKSKQIHTLQCTAPTPTPRSLLSTVSLVIVVPAPFRTALCVFIVATSTLRFFFFFFFCSRQGIRKLSSPMGSARSLCKYFDKLETL